ncbi:MAG: PEP-CTERM sorting domain-containing protein [Terracidiphilus sp.]
MIQASNLPKYLRFSPKLPLLWATLAAVFCFSATAHAGNIVLDSGFESAGGGNVYYAGQSIDGGPWTVTQGAVYIDNLDPWVYDGTNSVNLTLANLYAPNSLDQILSTVVGESYDVTFWADADTSNTFSLTANGVAVNGAPTSIVENGFPDQNDPLGNSALFVEYSGVFTATSTSTDLSFTATGNPEIGAQDASVMIDDASVTTPEPGSFLLLLTGILGLAFLMRSRRQRQSFSVHSSLI